MQAKREHAKQIVSVQTGHRQQAVGTQMVWMAHRWRGQHADGVDNTQTVWTACSSVAMAQADVFSILGNKIVKILKIFVEVDYLRSRGVLCQP